MPQPSQPQNHVPMLDETGVPSPPWAQWFTAIWKAAFGSRAFYIPTVAGAPTFTPEVRGGFVPMVYDTTNNKLWVYSGGWKSVSLT